MCVKKTTKNMLVQPPSEYVDLQLSGLENYLDFGKVFDQKHLRVIIHFCWMLFCLLLWSLDGRELETLYWVAY